MQLRPFPVASSGVAVAPDGWERPPMTPRAGNRIAREVLLSRAHFLPAVDRALVHAHFDLGMSLGEVAVLHGVTPRQARRRLEALRKRLADPCFVLAVQFARRLPRRFGGIASAYWIDGRTQREIAGEEGATLHQVRKRLQLARSLLTIAAAQGREITPDAALRALESTEVRVARWRRRGA